MLRVKVFIACGIGVWLMLGAGAGCGVTPDDPDDGADETPETGQEGGACLPGDTCAEGFECLDGLCVTPDEPGEGEGDGANPSEGDEGENDGNGETGPLLIFHNGSGPMCIEALDWLADLTLEYPALVVEEHLTTDPAEVEALAQLRAEYATSQGVSNSFAYLPIVFFEGRAYSGFNEEVADSILEAMGVDGSGGDGAPPDGEDPPE